MDPQIAGEYAHEMRDVHTALHHSLRLVQGVETIRAALDKVDGPVRYSPLHTTLEQAIGRVERVEAALLAASGQDPR